MTEIYCILELQPVMNLRYQDLFQLPLTAHINLCRLDFNIFIPPKYINIQECFARSNIVISEEVKIFSKQACKCSKLNLKIHLNMYGCLK